MPARLTRLLAIAAAFPGAAAALTLGEAQLRSPLGAPLDVRIPVARERGEPLEAACVTITSPGVAGAVPIADVDIALRRGPGRVELHVKSASAVTEPATAISVRIACPRANAEPVERLYVLLPVPATRAAPQQQPADATSIVSARDGDSLASLARALAGPRERRAGEWLARLRAANPALAERGDDTPLEAGAAISIPRPGAQRAAQAAPRGRPTELAAPSPPPPVLAEAAPAEPPRAKPAATPRPRAERPRAQATRTESRADRTRPAPPPALASSPGAFVLKLSAPEVDLSRSRQVDDRMRAQLRERQLVLDADDQLSALLAMRHNLRQLESRVAELQLKLSTLPAASTASPAPIAPKSEPTATKPEPVAAKPEPAPAKPDVVAAKPEPVAAKPEPVAAKPEPAPAKPAPGADPVNPAAVTADKPATTKPVGVKPKPDPAADPSLPQWLWLVAAAFAVAAIAAFAWMRRRRVATHETAPRVEPAGEDAAAGFGEPDPDDLQARPALPTDAMLATRLPDDTNALRRRYIEERFPEVVNGTIVLDDPGSVIKGARLFYEDGALPRAVELLQFAIEERPREPRTWLALFEIFRLERLTGEYAELAQRFREQHGEGDAWRKVRYFGREIDPGNPLYREDRVNTLETIGPREGRRLAAAMAAVDPIAENWLDAPMDFENEVLANELRNALMARANLTDSDLVANPMPALRHVEMFTVA